MCAACRVLYALDHAPLGLPAGRFSPSDPMTFFALAAAAAAASASYAYLPPVPFFGNAMTGEALSLVGHARRGTGGSSGEAAASNRLWSCSRA